MDKSEDSPESGRDQWVTLERAAVLVRSVAPGTLSLETRKWHLAKWAEDQTLRCRDMRTGQDVVPYQPCNPDGKLLPKLVPEVEIELRSLRLHLLHLYTKEGWPPPVDDILNLGSEGVDPEEVLERRLLASASAKTVAVEHERKSVQAAIERNKGGSPGKRFREEMAFLVGFAHYGAEVGGPAIVRSLILKSLRTRGLGAERGFGSRQWARHYMEWYERRNRET